jgi:DNA modification methylase
MSENNYYDDIKPENVWIFPNIGSSRQRKHYVEESMCHPAKMPTYLCQKIINKYSKPGDLILDPMVGIGTTVVEAILLGRNAIGVEYEEKFVKICKRNIEKVGLFREKMQNMGRAVIIKGDSRHLSQLLGENAGLIDNIAFSPPYADLSAKSGIDMKGRLHGRINLDKRKFTKQDLRHTLKTEIVDMVREKTYSSNPANIGNLPSGQIDTIITSPPFASSLAEPASDDTSKFKHGSAGKDYSDSKDNKEQLGNLNYGKVDSIISSPPCSHPSYITQTQAEGKTHKSDIAPKIHAKSDGYSGSPENIGNMHKETYLEAMLNVYKECFSVLKENGLMILVTKNFTRKGEMVRLDLDTIKLCQTAGFAFKERKYRKLRSTSFWIRNYRKKFYQKYRDKITGHPSADFEGILVFQKVV